MQVRDQIAAQQPRTGIVARLRLPVAFAGAAMPAVGVILIAIGLITPWLRVPLEPTSGAFSLPVLVTGVPTTSTFSYGGVVAVCLVGAAAAILWGRGRSSVGMALAGAATVLVPLYFVIQTVVTDRVLTNHLSEQQSELTSIIGQLGYSIPRNQLSSVLIVPVTGTWQQVLSALRPGWYLTLVGGALLFARGLPALSLRFRKRPRLPAVALGIVALALVATLGRGFAASLVLQSASDTLEAGDYASANARISLAEALNPALRSDAKEALLRGEALASSGDQTSSEALLYLASLRNSVHDEFGALALMEDAAGRDPTNDAVINTLLDQARRLATKRQDPGILRGVVNQPYGNRLAERYMLGRILYTRGDFDAARQQLAAAGALSSADTNVASSVHTYIALCDMRLGDDSSARSELLVAIRLDTLYINSLARTLATGLYVSGSI
jgi:tetratricopeptide (TPR) repeat protein